jgi:hypothetical protein
MATDTQKYATQVEREPRHSALAEFSRDERKPAVLLLGALLLSALFFGIGLIVGRWTAKPAATTTQTVPSGTIPEASTSAPVPQTRISPAANTSGETPSNAARRFALLVATYDTPEKAQTLIKTLQAAGYTDVRSSSPRAGEARKRYSVIVGHFTQDEARQAAERMHAANDPQLKNAKVIEDSGQ